MGGLVFAGVTVVLVLVMHGRWYGSEDFGLAIVLFASSTCSSALWTTISRSSKSGTSG
jgi:hypothetical protein